MIVRDFYQAYLKIVSNPQLNGFCGQPYGLELLFYLYFRQSDGLETSIDKIFFELTTPVPRREAFGRYLEKLASNGHIKKISHSEKKSMKAVRLSDAVMTAVKSTVA